MVKSTSVGLFSMLTCTVACLLTVISTYWIGLRLGLGFEHFKNDVEFSSSSQFFRPLWIDRQPTI